MPRPPRLNVPGMPQHVVQRGNNRQPCFSCTYDYQLYLRLLGAACLRHECRLHAFVLMTNHMHLLVTPETPDGVSLTIRDVGRDYVRQYNRSNGRTGTLWEGRFRSSLVDEDRYCLACYRYIEMNPVRAGLAATPQAYAWSSFRTNAFGVEAGEPTSAVQISPHPSWMALGSNTLERRRAYRRLFQDDLDPEALNLLRRSVRKGLPTGDRDFAGRVSNILSMPIGDRRIGRPPKKGPDTISD